MHLRKTGVRSILSCVLVTRIVSKVWSAETLLCAYVREKEEPALLCRFGSYKKENLAPPHLKIGKTGHTSHLDTKEMEPVQVNFWHIDPLRLLHQLDTI